MDECQELIQLYEAHRNRRDLQVHYGQYRVVHYVNFPPGSGPRRLIASVAQRVHRFIENWFGPTFIEYAGVVCMPPGGGHPAHADNCRWDKAAGQWVPNHTPYRSFSSLLYLGTHGQDFGGGEFQWVDPFDPQKIHRSITPTAGMLVAFPSTQEFYHQVPPVTWGLRYSFPVWFTQDPARDLLSK